MLSHISIRDFAIVERLELELGGGFTALTGETGAGKSIVVDALALVLGGRASPEAIRRGCRSCDISAVVDLSGAPALEKRLSELELATQDGECILRRIVHAGGRSRAFVNNHPVPIQTLRELGHGLIEIHAQHAHHALLRPEQQRLIVDAFGGHGAETAAVADAHARLAALFRERETLQVQAGERESRSEYVKFQLGELAALDPTPGEGERLQSEHTRLVNGQEIAAAGTELASALRDDDSSALFPGLRAALDNAELLRGYDPNYAEIAESLASTIVELEEAGRSARHLAESFEHSPERLGEVERRLSALHDAARKHRCRIEELPERVAELEAESARLVEIETALATVERRHANALSAYESAALVLGERRRTAAPQLARAVSSLLAEMGMEKARFEIVVEGPTSSDEPVSPSPYGDDRVEFRASTNAGQPPQPLARIASGGELSRISLALQAAGAARTGSSTLVFDEVDVGIGGGVAERIGRYLRSVGATKQVLCITHLPQVAARAHHHILVAKHESKDTTYTEVAAVHGEERVREIARMLGGIEITDRTLDHAHEMLQAEPIP